PGDSRGRRAGPRYQGLAAVRGPPPGGARRSRGLLPVPARVATARAARLGMGPALGHAGIFAPALRQDHALAREQPMSASSATTSGARAPARQPAAGLARVLGAMP